MKRSYIILVITTLSLLTGLSSCHKFLDQQPITETGPELVFKDVASTQKALAGVYSRLVGDQGYGIRLSLYYPLDNDEMQGPTGAGDNDRRDIARMQPPQVMPSLQVRSTCCFRVSSLPIFVLRIFQKWICMQAVPTSRKSNCSDYMVKH